MKKYKVGFYYEEVGYLFVTAKSKQEAKNKASEQLGEKGLDDLKFLQDYEVNDRNYGTNEVEAI